MVIIESAELQFKQILEEFFVAVYDEKSLPSHGIDHHRRVWCYSKELLSILPGINPAELLQLPGKLIIASYLHDIGMAVESGIRHGKHSRNLCIQFLIRNNLPENDYQDVLTAIENHDRKDYPGGTSVNDLLKILSIADDLDALGFTGIFRYSEIYLTRGINPSDIGRMVKDNAEKRFDNFTKTFEFSDLLVHKHRKRYDILDNFFNEYNKQAISYQFGGHHHAGYCGVIEMLNYVVQHKIEFEDICKEPEKFSNDQTIRWFFNELAHESINNARSIKP